MTTNPARRKKILFITPLASRTGSEMMLWYILQGFDRSRFEVAVASYGPGVLMKDVPADVRSFILPGKFTYKDKLMYHLGMDPIKSMLRKIQEDFKADLWYLNTIVLPEAADMAVSLGVPFVSHFHEMPLSFIYVREAEFETIIKKSARIIGCSQATCDGITRSGGDRVSLLYSFIDPSLVRPDFSNSIRIRKELNILPGDFVWIMSGTTSERKGFDFFPEIAEGLDDAAVHLIWVGGRLSNGYVYAVEERLRRSGSRTKVHLSGEQTKAYADYLNAADGFLLTSRQDPFPLVMIESGILGKPIVSFPSGGVSEFVTPRTGYVTSDFNVGQLIGKMKMVMRGDLGHHPEEIRDRALVFNVEKGIKRWEEIIESVFQDLR